MLVVKQHRSKKTRHLVTLSQPTTALRSSLWYKYKSCAGRSGKGRITINAKQKPYWSKQLALSRLPALLLPGTVTHFILLPLTGHLRAHVKTVSGRSIIIPAVRGLAIGNIVNINQSLGSFVPPILIPRKQPFCNIINKYYKPQLLTAPGTYAKSLRRSNILLPRRRYIYNVYTKFVQIGINANHDWRHTILGIAGQARRKGCRPRVRNKAKNVCSRTKGIAKFKKTRLRLP
jgi:ribosomal protein L2